MITAVRALQLELGLSQGELLHLAREIAMNESLVSVDQLTRPEELRLVAFLKLEAAKLALSAALTA